MPTKLLIPLLLSISAGGFAVKVDASVAQRIDASVAQRIDASVAQRIDVRGATKLPTSSDDVYPRLLEVNCKAPFKHRVVERVTSRRLENERGETDQLYLKVLRTEGRFAVRQHFTVKMALRDQGVLYIDASNRRGKALRLAIDFHASATGEGGDRRARLKIGSTDGDGENLLCTVFESILAEH